MHELDGSLSPSNDVDDEEERALVHIGRLLLAGAHRCPRSLRVGIAPLPEQPAPSSILARAVAVTAIREAFADDAELATGSPTGWQERVLDQIEEIEADGPTSRERPRHPPGSTP